MGDTAGHAPEVRIPPWLPAAAFVAAAVGILGTAAGLAGALGPPKDTWVMLLVNFLFWTGLAQGMFVWSAIFRTAQATWPAALNRLGHAAWGFLPISLALFALLYAGRQHWLTWLHQPVHGKEIWLNEGFFFVRDAASLAWMTLLSGLLLLAYRAGERAGDPEAEARAHRRANRIATALVISYAFLYSLLAFDLVMSLEPHWYSSLLGGYYFVSNLYLAMAGLILAAIALRRPLGLTDRIGERQFRDMGNLLMGFGLLTAGFFFAQYLTIWYGNLPEETSYLIRRAYTEPWRSVGFVLLAGCYLGPFLVLAFPAVKGSPRLLGVVAVLVVAAMFVERWMLVMPTFAPQRAAGLGLAQWSIALGCAGLLVLVMVSALARRPQPFGLDVALRLSEGVDL